ncbi:DUF885 family protein [Emticicia sp. CRIBPO]|uniref:DUF885 domain-containing protein n=1 Tax=Emticicia sp. CRIBPO TaxID=2683258 RepID=UPI0014135A0B|nr:DUF885 domain-containing protein [Emticicia sp. CRIBPO]NBA88420.1 DUF885 family protein [Emticicia sp. CRIBPO]
MKKVLFLLISAGIISSCQSESKKNGGMADSTFQKFSDGFIEDLWKNDPEWATQAGYHKYDSLLTIPDSLGFNASLTFVNANLDSLKQYKPEELNTSHQTDYYMISDFLESRKWEIETKKQYTWDPSYYNVGGLFAFMLSENYAPIETRLVDFGKRLRYVPDYYKAAKANIVNPAEELRTLAIDQNTGGLSVFETELTDAVKKSKLSDKEKSEITALSKDAVAAIKDYVGWLKNLKSAQPRSFRLGKQLYETKFKYDIQSAYTAAQIYDSALVRKQYLHGEMFKISRKLWPKYFGSKPAPTDTLILIGKMIDTLSVKHVRPEEFQTAIEKQIPELVKFIKDKNLVYLDESKPLVVRKEPAYMGGVAGASISAPGPYDKKGNTYYNVGSLAGWTPERSESYLREYNHYILQILNIHEAIPGHYAQLVYSNLSPSLIKSILGNGAMVEGWAVYTEQMMLENGYGDNEPEMWLMWYKWNLRTVCNTILDYQVHVKDLSKEGALQLLTKEAFQQQAEAEGKWRRVNVSSVQLTSYYTGYKEIIDLREKVKKKEGDKFNLKAFHEKFLSYGSAPVKYISRLMLE